MDKFGEHVRSTAFNLSLSQSMIDCLLLLESDSENKLSCFAPFLIANFTATENSLLRRGLIERHTPAKGQRTLGLTEITEITDAIVLTYPQLTKAGKAVADLLKIAGFTAKEVRERRAG